MNLAYYSYNRGIDGDFKPTPDGTTFCNLSIQYVCTGFGYDKFNGLNANDIISYMNAPENGWIQISDDVAQSHANTGVIVIAGRKKEGGHGHVSLIIPGLIEKAGSACKSVPKCVNIGKEVFIGKKLSFAFKYPYEEPTLYALAAMI